MTLLITAAARDCVVSVTDRRTSVLEAGKFRPVDERFNKHIYFTLQRDASQFLSGATFFVRGAATFTGLARWRGRMGRTITTDVVIADAIASVARAKGSLGDAMVAIAGALADEFRQCRAAMGSSPPEVVVNLAGFTNAVADPWFAAITTPKWDPGWAENEGYQSVPAPEPFRIHFTFCTKPAVMIQGYTHALSADAGSRLLRLSSQPRIGAFDIANLAVHEIRRASARTRAIGRRCSAVVLPSKGFLDTGLWDELGEPFRTAFPRFVFPDGVQWEPSEADMDVQGGWDGEHSRHGIWLRARLENRIARRLKRRWLRLRNSSATIPTVFQVLMFTLYGGHWDKDSDSKEETLELRQADGGFEVVRANKLSEVSCSLKP